MHPTTWIHRSKGTIDDPAREWKLPGWWIGHEIVKVVGIAISTWIMLTSWYERYGLPACIRDIRQLGPESTVEWEEVFVGLNDGINLYIR
jgi:hypothetical protein